MISRSAAAVCGGKRAFTEQVPGPAAPHARPIGLLRGMLESIGPGRAGAWPAGRLGLAVGGTADGKSCARPDPTVGTVVVLGVDDFALRR